MYGGDGTVAVTVGGMEMGQGLNTKVAQVVAQALGVTDATLIKVKAANNFVGNNNATTGGSFGSEVTCSVRHYHNPINGSATVLALYVLHTAFFMLQNG